MWGEDCVDSCGFDGHISPLDALDHLLCVMRNVFDDDDDDETFRTCPAAKKRVFRLYTQLVQTETSG